MKQAYVGALLQQSAPIATMAAAVATFFDLLRHRRGDGLDAWAWGAGAKASGIPQLLAFAEGIRRDYAAIRAAFDLPWSQGDFKDKLKGR